jgi:hypothetical protein
VAIQTREIHQSANGDRWFLVCDSNSGSVFVKHQANAPSGGHVTEVDIGAFLSIWPRNPEHEALLRLIRTLVQDSSRPRRHRGRQNNTTEAR